VYEAIHKTRSIRKKKTYTANKKGTQIIKNRKIIDAFHPQSKLERTSPDVEIEGGG